jgi:RNA recognition motif-containing protein
MIFRALFDHFKSCGRIRNAQVIVNEANGKSKGFARIDFNKVKDADDAVLDFNKTKFQGRPLIVKSWAEDERVTLYVGNLSYDTQDQELERLFSPFGKFLDAEIVKHNGRSKGFALVDFKSVDSAKRAMNKLDGTEFQGRPIYVRWDKDSADPQRDTQRNSPRNAGVTKKSSLVNDLPNTTVFVGNLDYECRWQDLKDLFKRVGRVEHAEIVENPVTKRSKGFGLVKFLTSSQAQLAIEKIDGTEFQNRCVQVKWDKKGQPVDSEESTFSFKRRSLSPKRSTSPKAAPKPAPERPAPSLDAALSSSR